MINVLGIKKKDVGQQEGEHEHLRQPHLLHPLQVAKMLADPILLGPNVQKPDLMMLFRLVNVFDLVNRVNPRPDEPTNTNFDVFKMLVATPNEPVCFN